MNGILSVECNAKIANIYGKFEKYIY